MKPLIFYVDDEPKNLVVFEAAIPDTWEVRIFDAPMKAIEALDTCTPCVIVSDQMMPSMKGVQFLELARKLQPDAIRIIVTGYSDEDLVVESVRRARIYDYIKKPWDSEDLESRIGRAIEFYDSIQEKKRLQSELEQREKELKERNSHLEKTLVDLELAKSRESALRAEIECWVPPFVRRALQDPTLKFPIKKDIVGIAFDIVSSSQIHNAMYQNRHIRSHIIELFSLAVIRHGGWRESHSGDSAYGHFGLLSDQTQSVDLALAAAREFRTGLRELSTLSGTAVECGISLHVAKNCTVDIHNIQMSTPSGVVSQKSFDTTSSDIDLLHRMEKLVHSLPGSNIILSESFVEALRGRPPDVFSIGEFHLAGQGGMSQFYLIKSDKVQPEHLEQLAALAVKNAKVA